ncbi:MAG: putative molybdenum carrier protein [bacterium]|nr:putative molybdenum carrier protein [bacterium]
MKIITMLISGAQTGADRGGLEAAMALGIPTAGYIPKGRKAEDGIIPYRYQGLTETTSTNYLVRTRKNVETADLTLIFTYGKLAGGSLRTAEFATKANKPWLHINLVTTTPEVVIQWILQQTPDVGIVNIAGSRGSKAPTLENDVKNFLLNVLLQFKKLC